MNRGAKQNGRSGSPAAIMGPRARTLTNNSSDANAEQMRKLEALFGGNSSPSRATAPAAAPRSFASPRRHEGRELSKYTIRRRTLESAREPEAVRRAAADFLEHHALPDDMSILLKLLQHDSEKVLCDVMGLISLQLHRKRAKPTIILTDRLQELKSRTLSAATQSCLDGLQGQIATLQGGS